MNIEKAKKKLREMEFFLKEMANREKQLSGDKEPFDFCLSAFLNAATTFRNEFHVEQDRKSNDAIKNQIKDWEKSLSAEDFGLYDFLRKDRVAEVHLASGSRRQIKIKEEEIRGNSYQDSSVKIEIFAPPGAPPATIRKPFYFFEINGAERSVVDACRHYLKLLSQMGEQFFNLSDKG